MEGFAFFLFFSIVDLTYLKPKSLANAQMPQLLRQDIPLSEAQTLPSAVKMRPVSVELQRFALTLNTKTSRSVGTDLRQETILQPISAKFELGVLNVILGPSGSGKSSLLNDMAQTSRLGHHKVPHIGEDCFRWRPRPRPPYRL